MKTPAMPANTHPTTHPTTDPTTPPSKPTARSASTPLGSVSKTLCRQVDAISWAMIPEMVKHEARRSIVNYFAVAFAGSVDATIQRAIASLSRFAANQHAPIIGCAERTDMLNAAALNAMSANVYDFDDTHLRTVIHPTAPVAAALFAYAAEHTMSGEQFLHALILGMEVECRLGNAISPEHYARGFHITSTCGVVGAATAVGHFLALNDAAMNDAIGCAANQACGIVETLGTMSKSLSVGNAARNGLLSALMARDGFGGPADPLGGARGFLNIYGDHPRTQEIIGEFGERWEMAANTYKPYPCGVVLNPVIEACLALHQDQTLQLLGIQRIQSIEIKGHPLLRERTDRPNVLTGRASQVSAQHAAPIALITGKAGLNAFSDLAVNREDVRALGRKVIFVDDNSFAIDSATVTITLHNGEQRSIHIPHAQGSAAIPMSDAALEAKLRDLHAHAGVKCDADRLIQALWQIDHSEDVARVVQLACPTMPGGR